MLGRKRDGEKEEDEEVGRSCDCTLRDHIFVSLPCPGLVRQEVGPNRWGEN